MVFFSLGKRAFMPALLGTVIMGAAGFGCNTSASVVVEDSTAHENITRTSVTGASEQVSRDSGTTIKTQTHTLRLMPGADLRHEIETYVTDRHISAGHVATCVGSVRRASLRLADQKESRTWEKKFEIVSLDGTVGTGGVHLHISLSDETGATIGGHLVDGCLIYTTAEIVIVEQVGLRFDRSEDTKTGFRELQIRSAN